MYSCLFDMAEEKYRLFALKLLPDTCQEKLIGVRLPKLRHLAKEIAHGDYQSFLALEVPPLFEAEMLFGFVIGYAPLSDDEKIFYLERFLPMIDNWSVCDSVCCSLKFSDKDELWRWLESKLKACSEQEYVVRFCFVMMLNNFVSSAYLKRILVLVRQCPSSAYYVKMAQAWLLSVLFVPFPDVVEAFIFDKKTDALLLSLTVQKICDSLRVERSVKQRLRALKKSFVS